MGCNINQKIWCYTKLSERSNQVIFANTESVNTALTIYGRKEKWLWKRKLFGNKHEKIIRKLVCFIIPERKRHFFEEIVNKIFFPSPDPKDFISCVSDSCTAMFIGNLFTKTRKLGQEVFLNWWVDNKNAHYLQSGFYSAVGKCNLQVNEWN